MKLKTINVISVPNGTTGEQIIGLYSDFSKKKAIVVSVRVPSTLLNQQLQERNIDTPQFFFVDCLGKEKEESPQIVKVQGPAALTEISLCVKNALSLIKPDVIIFDTLSNFLYYVKDISILHFIHDMSISARIKNCKMLIIVEQKDLEGKLSGIVMLSDTVIKI